MLYELEFECSFNYVTYKRKRVPNIGAVMTTRDENGNKLQVVIREITNLDIRVNTIKMDLIGEDVVGKDRFKIIK